MDDGSAQALWKLAIREAQRRGGSPRRYAALLRRAARAGSARAEADFATLQMEGYRDRRGRIIVRANPKAAARAYARALSAGEESAAHNLGYCFDVGVGVHRDGRRALELYRRSWRRGHVTSAVNIGAVYRDRGLLGRAVEWWKRAMRAGLPEEAVEVGYCYQYGIGVRRDIARAVRCYRLAIRGRDVFEVDREAAMYHLALLDLDRKPPRRAAAVALLRRAARDRDYPEAMDLLDQLRRGQKPLPCRCRRFLDKRLPGHARCAVHAGSTVGSGAARE